MSKLEIWVLPGQPLKEQEWLDAGYTSLGDYINRLITGHAGHLKVGCITCMRTEKEPLVSFGSFNPKTGAKDVQKVCKNEEELPMEDITGILEFNKND